MIRATLQLHIDTPSKIVSHGLSVGDPKELEQYYVLLWHRYQLPIVPTEGMYIEGAGPDRLYVIGMSIRCSDLVVSVKPNVWHGGETARDKALNFLNYGAWLLDSSCPNDLTGE